MQMQEQGVDPVEFSLVESSWIRNFLVKFSILFFSQEVEFKIPKTYIVFIIYKLF